MGAAILQGVPASTFDTDLWIDLPERQYMRLINLALKQGGTMIRQTVVALSDGAMINFCYRLNGLASFDTEYRRAKSLAWRGVRLKVLPLARIIRSKEAAGRDKDLAMLPILRDVEACRKRLRR